MDYQELIDDLKGRINLQYADCMGTESYERKQCLDAIESLLNALDVAEGEVKRTATERDELKNKNALLSAHVELYGEEARRLDDLSTDYARRIVHWVEKHNATKAERDAALAELAKYRDAPVVAYRHLMEDGWEYFDAPTGEDCPKCVPLIVKPGE